MPSNGSSSPSPYFHHASAFGIAGQITRPTQQTIAPQAAISLAPSGGHGTHRVDNYSVPGVLSFKAAYVEVGGSLDEAHGSGTNDSDTNDCGTHTTYATSVIEDLNIFNIVTADRVVSRLTIYYPAKEPLPPPAPQPEPRFSIAGSYFDNLKIAGQKIDVQLDHKTFHDSTYTTFADGLRGEAVPNRHVLMASNIDLTKLSASDHNCGIVCGAAEKYQQWKPKGDSLVDGQHFWCSAANRPGSAQQLAQTEAAKPSSGPESGDLGNFGGVICVPRFGVVYLAEVLVYRNHRHLTMIRVRMCSPGDGSIDGTGSSGGGDGMPPRP